MSKFSNLQEVLDASGLKVSATLREAMEERTKLLQQDDPGKGQDCGSRQLLTDQCRRIDAAYSLIRRYHPGNWEVEAPASLTALCGATGRHHTGASAPPVKQCQGATRNPAGPTAPEYPEWIRSPARWLVWGSHAVWWAMHYIVALLCMAYVLAVIAGWFALFAFTVEIVREENTNGAVSVILGIFIWFGTTWLAIHAVGLLRRLLLGNRK